MPPAGVKKGTKRARQYEKIKESQKDQGRSESRAEEIAARTVNKERARSGESRDALAQLDGRHLVLAARRPALGYEPAEGPHPGSALQRGEALGIEGRSSMNKDQLQRAVAGKKS